MLKIPTSRRTTGLLAATIVPTMVVALLGAASPVAGQDDPAATPTIGVIESAQELPECAPSEIGGVPADAAPTALYQIVSEESAARYRVQEELVDVGANEAVGETNAIVGQIMFGPDGLPLACSRFDVDLRTLTSDEARRDNFLYNNTLQTETYPLATFVLRSVEGLDAPLADGQAAELTLIGDLTFHGVTKLVAWQATATLEGETLSGSAKTTFEMPDFAIEKPTVRSVLSVDETVNLEIDLTATPAA